MIEEDKHNDHGFSEELHALLKHAAQRQEFALPEDFFDAMENELVIRVKLEGHREQEFQVPEGHFDEAHVRILASLEEDKVDDDLFERQQDQILSQLNILKASGNSDDLALPDNFFQEQEKKIIAVTSGRESRTRIIHLNRRILSFTAAAACLAIAMMLLWPSSPTMSGPSFSSLLDTTALDEDDLDYFASDNDYYDLYLHETEMMADTLVRDSLDLTEFPDSLSMQGNGPLDPKTGLPLKKVNGKLKPSERQKAPTLDELSEEDILKYLLEESDDDMINELN